MVNINFNAEEELQKLPEDQRGEFPPLPDSWYTAQIIESEQKATKAGTGHYLQLTFEILDDTYRGRRAWARLNIDNPSEEAVRIAKADLAKICQALKINALNDTQQLHNSPLQIRVIYKEGDKTFGPSNEIRGYKAIVVSASSTSAEEEKTEAPSWTQPKDPS
jgi:hypothetical protein|tara:strand:+ start:3432 stop:3920 length:489 start_codon:yes stop_codon:yes gene_type:complete